MAQRSTLRAIILLAAVGAAPCHAAAPPDGLSGQFADAVHPFLETYCFGCHGEEQPEAGLNLAAYSSIGAVLADSGRLNQLVERLDAEEMPPADADQPSLAQRRAAIAWLNALRAREMRENAGDPGVVLARRLSNAEYDYTIRDLTGVDIRPTREFPVDPANTAGFDNSGETLAMSPALLSKYMTAARDVASHMYLKPGGFAFAPFPMLAETDRDKYCVGRIIDFYRLQNTELADYLADYFEAAWRYKHRAPLGNPDATLAGVAVDCDVSPKYLATIFSTLDGDLEEIGPLAKLQKLWHKLPEPKAADAVPPRRRCERMRDDVIAVRKKVEPRFLNIVAGRLDASFQPFLIYKNVQYATHRMTFDPGQLQVEGEPLHLPSLAPEPGADNEFGPGHTRLVQNIVGDPDLRVPAGERAKYEAAFAKFCRIFPDKFVMQERGRNYFDESQDRGRYLSAGFHSLMGYFRDDQPLYELLLDSDQQRELDALWFELDFVASSNSRMFIEFYSNARRRAREADDAAAAAEPAEHGEGQRRRDRSEADLTPPVDGQITAEASIKQLEASLLERTTDSPDDAVGVQAIKDYFAWINGSIRKVEKARADAEPSHVEALLAFAAKAYRRPLTQAERDDLVAFYRSARENDAMDHESAIRESIVAVLMAPDLCYRIDLGPQEDGVHALTDYELASRLSYFLWSSAPDDELLAHAAAGDLHEPKVIAAQARRMLADPRIQALAVEFGCNWLDIRRFQEIATVDRERFAAFDDALRDAMFEEPVRLLVDVIQRDRPVLDLLYGHDTFVNSTLAKHYGIPAPSAGAENWVHVDDANKYGRGGLLPMAVFLTKNAPGLRTSPVKRGNWVVKNVLGERIPPPPPVVPELPQDEAKLDLPLRDLLARHRADPNCAACHARFDSLGLAFEGFGPIGERRELDLAGRPVDASGDFPDGSERAGVDGLQQYIRDKRQDDFVDNLCRKLLAFALGRSLMLTDDPLIAQMRSDLAAHDDRFESMIENIVASRQFLNKRGRTRVAER